MGTFRNKKLIIHVRMTNSITVIRHNTHQDCDAQNEYGRKYEGLLHVRWIRAFFNGVKVLNTCFRICGAARRAVVLVFFVHCIRRRKKVSFLLRDNFDCIRNNLETDGFTTQKNPRTASCPFEVIIIGPKQADYDADETAAVHADQIAR